MWRMCRRAILTGAILSVMMTGCGPDFEPYWKIDKLRVMAIQSDPVVAKHMEPVTLSALVYAPGEPEIDYDWSWCPVRVSAEDNYECPIGEEELSELAEAFNSSDASENGGDDENGDSPPDLGDDPFDLGDGEQATFINFFEEDGVREFCEAIQEQILEQVDDPELAEFLPGGDCSEGYEVTVRLEVSSEGDSLVASKRFMLWGGAEEYNENPRFEDFEIRPAEASDLDKLRDQAGWDIPAGADHDDQWVSVPEDEDLRAIFDIPLEFRALVDPDSVQEYFPTGSDRSREEAFVYRHFATAGWIRSSRRLFSPDQNTLEDASKTGFSVGDDIDCQEEVDDGCRVRIWSVVRDGRLGVDWIGRSLLFEEGE